MQLHAIRIQFVCNLGPTSLSLYFTNIGIGVVVDKTSSRTVCLKQIGHEAQEWRFDYVADGAISQQEMFQGRIPSPGCHTAEIIICTYVLAFAAMASTIISLGRYLGA